MSEFPKYDAVLTQACALINAQQPDKALELMENIEVPENLEHARALAGLITWADTLRLTGKPEQAIELYEYSARQGGALAPLLWRRVAEVEMDCQKLDEAMRHIKYSLSLAPNSEESQYIAAKLCFTSTLFIQGCSHAHYLLQHSEDDESLVVAENVFRFAQQPQDAYAVVLKRAEISGDPDYFLGLLTCAAQGICNWKEAERYAERLETQFYQKCDFISAREIPLYNIARTSVEATNLAVAKVAMEEVNQLEPAFDISDHQWNGRLRIGFLSADFSSHPVIMLLIGLFENIDQERFEIYAYDDGMKSGGEQYQRFARVVSHHVDVRERPDRDVAQMVHDDGVDILIDLMGLTTKNRIGVLALRPCPVTASFLGFPGSTGVSAVDYMITDAVITPDSSKEYFAEKLCRLPEVFMPNDNKRMIAANPVNRATVGLPDHAFVFASFNRSFKLDRQSVELWMRILARTPNSVLWQKADEDNMKQVFHDCAIEHGVDPERIIFAGNAGAVSLHLARAGLADLGLDTLIYNGHTITADLLWAGVPVLTRTGTHFASRVSTSLLHSVGLEELATQSVQEMEDLAVALALNPARMQALRERLAKNKRSMPLFDTERYTRHFELGLTMMADRAKAGLAAEHIDVPPMPKRPVGEEIFLPDGPPQRIEEYFSTKDGQPYTDTSGDLAVQKNKFAHHFGTCPLCGGISPSVGIPIPWAEKAHWVPPLAPVQLWVACPHCGHMHTMGYWQSEAINLLHQRECEQAQLDYTWFATERSRWLPLLHTVQGLIDNDIKDKIWLDVGCGDGGLALCAQAAGFFVNTLDLHAGKVEALQRAGMASAEHDFITANFNGQAHVLSLCGTLEESPYPALVLEHAHKCMAPNALLVVGFSDRDGLAWNLAGALAPQNPIMAEMHRLHQFSRSAIVSLLTECGFSVLPTWELDPGNTQGIFLLARACPKETAPLEDRENNPKAQLMAVLSKPQKQKTSSEKASDEHEEHQEHQEAPGDGQAAEPEKPELDSPT